MVKDPIHALRLNTRKSETYAQAGQERGKRAKQLASPILSIKVLLIGSSGINDLQDQRSAC